jgi:DNA-binding NtrC family response regulator
MNAMHKVLIANDDPECLSTLRNGLRMSQSQCEVLTASGAQGAIVGSSQDMASVPVTDLVMPKANAAKPLAHMNKKHPATASMAIRGVDILEIKRRANQEDVLRYFQTPSDCSAPR